jgi:hypothetical protein
MRPREAVASNGVLSEAIGLPMAESNHCGEI